MMLSLVYWHLLHSSLSGGIKSKETLYWEKKNCVREMTVEVRFISGYPGCYLWISRDFPYNRGGCNVDSIQLDNNNNNLFYIL